VGVGERAARRASQAGRKGFEVEVRVARTVILGQRGELVITPTTLRFLVLPEHVVGNRSYSGRGPAADGADVILLKDFVAKFHAPLANEESGPGDQPRQFGCIRWLGPDRPPELITEGTAGWIWIPAGLGKPK
jgi:hypothetical protein